MQYWGRAGDQKNRAIIKLLTAENALNLTNKYKERKGE
jgi:hypothetical protein